MTNNFPIKPKTAEERLEALARSANVTRIKFNSGNWTISDLPVPADTRFVLYPDQVSHSWTHFADGKAVDEISAIVAEDDDGDTELKIVKGKARENLGFDDEAKWEPDSAGKRRDPWVYGFGLPIKNAKTGAFLSFKTATHGGMGAIAGEVASFTRNRHLGYPVVTLSTGSYKNKNYGGFTPYPVFVNVGYDNPRRFGEDSPRPGGGNGGNGARVINAGNAKIDAPAARDREVDDMNDDIPF